LKEKQEKSFHQYSTIPGIRESIDEILQNLKTSEGVWYKQHEGSYLF
jgi:hypothetical protein